MRAVRVHAGRAISVADIAAYVGAELIVDEFAWVDTERQTAHTDKGAELAYDALLLALGARIRAPFGTA